MAGEWNLTHDEQGRLVAASVQGLTTTHAYDGFGNAIRHVVAGVVTDSFQAFNVEALPDNRIPGLPPNGTPTGWVIEANGEASQLGTGVASGSSLGVSWDGLGRVAMLVESRSGATQTYRYAPSGYLASLTDHAAPAGGRKFLYTNGGLLLAAYLGDGRWDRDVVYLGNLAIAEIDGTGVHELHADHLGTPRVITSGRTGAVEGRQAFGPYGEAMAFDGYRPLTGFTGHLRTESNGLIYMRGRFYSPAWHRFLNPDHGSDPSSWTQYGYAGGNPFQRVDPTGLKAGDPSYAGEATVEVRDTCSRNHGSRESGISSDDVGWSKDLDLLESQRRASQGPEPSRAQSDENDWEGENGQGYQNDLGEHGAEPDDDSRISASAIQYLISGNPISSLITPVGQNLQSLRFKSKQDRLALENLARWWPSTLLVRPSPAKQIIADSGVFIVNRRLHGRTPVHGPISHTFVFTTNKDGSLQHTYSWSNNGLVRGAWVLDAEADVNAAQMAIVAGVPAEIVGNIELIQFIDIEFRSLKGISSEMHPNLGVTSNCKTEAKKLIKGAQQLLEHIGAD